MLARTKAGLANIIVPPPVIGEYLRIPMPSRVSSQGQRGKRWTDEGDTSQPLP